MDLKYCIFPRGVKDGVGQDGGIGTLAPLPLYCFTVRTIAGSLLYYPTRYLLQEQKPAVRLAGTRTKGPTALVES